MTAMSGNAGFEVSQHKDELIPILRQIASDHCERNGCEMQEGYIEAILCDLSFAFERQEKNCGAKAA